MKVLLPVAIAAAALSGLPDSLGPIGKKSNSAASAQRGREAFVEQRFEDAVREFGVAADMRPGPAASFNLGTAQIAAGDVAGGLQSLAPALEDTEIATDVRYNAGWAALGAGDFDNAIRAYEQVLRERPGDANAKRNLEIALRKKEQQPQPGGRNPEPQPQQQPDDGEQPGDQPPPEAETGQQPPASDAESILRSVEQQEKEELDRMRKSRRGRKVDW